MKEKIEKIKMLAEVARLRCLPAGHKLDVVMFLARIEAIAEELLNNGQEPRRDTNLPI